MLVQRRTPLRVCTFSTAVWCAFNRPCRPVLEICAYKYHTALVQLVKEYRGTSETSRCPVLLRFFSESLKDGVKLHSAYGWNANTCPIMDPHNLTGRLESAAAVIVHPHDKLDVRSTVM